MGNFDYLSSQGGKDILMMVVRCASIHPDEIDAFNKKYFNKKTGKLPDGIVSPEHVRDAADKVLYAFSEPDMSELLDDVSKITVCY